MSRQPRKTNRPRSYPVDYLLQLARLADTTNIRAAARAEGVSTTTVRKALKLAGLRAKPIGAPRIYNERVAMRIVRHRLRSGSTKATANRFGVDHTTVTRFLHAYAPTEAAAA